LKKVIALIIDDDEGRSHDGVRGWWRSLCSNQVTNCS